MNNSNAVPTMTDEELLLLNEVVSRQFGLYFPEHKREILASRLRPRLEAHHLHSYHDYYLSLRYDRGCELQRLAEVLSNNETYFFRETHQFEALFGPGLAELGVAGPRGGDLRVLSAGCSSGEEPYSLAIHAGSAALPGVLRWSIEGIDIDALRLSRAREARYGPHALRALPAETVPRYFHVAEGDAYELRQRYRQGVSFRMANIMELTSFGTPRPYDVIFCRNVFIYFSETAIQQAIDNFSRLLRPGGLLFLGHSESLIGQTTLFETVRLGRGLAYRSLRG